MKLLARDGDTDHDEVALGPRAVVEAPVAATAGKTRAEAVPPLVTDMDLAPHATAAIPVNTPQPGNAVCTAALRAASRTPWRTEIESLNHSP